MDKSRVLNQYCDLTEARYWALWEAVEGTHAGPKINGAMREAMGPMLDDQGQITAYGKRVWTRADQVMRGWKPETPVEVAGMMSSTGAIGRWLKKRMGKQWGSAHAKAMCWLPGAYKATCNLFGYDVVEDLRQADLVTCEWIRVDGLTAGPFQVGMLLELTETGKALMVEARQALGIGGYDCLFALGMRRGEDGRDDGN